MEDQLRKFDYEFGLEDLRELLTVKYNKGSMVT